MKKTLIISISVLIALPLLLWAEGSKEESGNLGKYVAEQGMIISPDKIHIDSYIAQIDYHYPDPEGNLSIVLETGHNQVSIHGQEEIIQIGLQGKREKFEDLPPMNIAFVFDKSGSMTGKDKIQWVKEAFSIFIRRLREKDTVSIIAFAEKADVLFPATRLDKIADREELIEMVFDVKPEGASYLKAGLRAGYEQVFSKKEAGSINRILFISDGLGEYNDILNLADQCKKEEINVSTIGVGVDYDLDLMTQLSSRSGGSSRFISSEEKISEIFNIDLDRMVVPVARDLLMEIEFLQEVEIRETWGYNHTIKGKKIQYSLPTLHHRDYETILIWVKVLSGKSAGMKNFARFSLTYRDMSGKYRYSGPYFIKLKYTDSTVFQSGFSNPLVLKAGTMLHIAQSLKDIGTLYYSCLEDNQKFNFYYLSIWQNRDVEQKTKYDDIVMLEKDELMKSIRARKQRCLDIAVELNKEIHNAQLRLEGELFKEEQTIFEMYIKTLSRELGLSDKVTSKLLDKKEFVPTPVGKSTRGQISDFINELTLELDTEQAGLVIFGGFSQKDKTSSSLKHLVDDMAIAALKKMPSLQLMQSEEFESFLKEKKLLFDDLKDTDVAVKIATELKADYMITGLIIEMPESVILFARILNGKTGAVESVAQLVLPFNEQVRTLLSRST